jgi:phenylacetate-coenzyme A ligase PaaK-like adenylate-forming protein
MNTTMPFIRYGTEDYVEIDEKGNVVAIIGRSSDFVINTKNDIVPCIIIARNESKKNVLNFQYYQDSPGQLVYRVVVNNKFTLEEKKMLEDDLTNSFDNKMTCKVVVVSSIERTKIGKQKRLIQKLDLSKY